MFYLQLVKIIEKNNIPGILRKSQFIMKNNGLKIILNQIYVNLNSSANKKTMQFKPKPKKV